MAIRTHIGAGARRYRALVGLPEARWPLVFSVAGSMPIGMYGLAILLLVRESNGSFAVAGRGGGAVGLGAALGAGGVRRGERAGRRGPGAADGRPRPVAGPSARGGRPRRDARRARRPRRARRAG